MNYLNYKKQFPKSINVFFDWVSKQNSKNQNNYIDNVYFYQFFSKYFDYRQGEHTNALFIDTKKEYFQQLKSELVSRSLDENFCHFFENNRILFNNYSDTNTEYIKIIIKSESSFESAFFVLEILIENAYYGR
jgi:hypothetical protein